MWRDNFRNLSLDQFFIEDNALQQLILEAISEVNGVARVAFDHAGPLKKPINIVRNKDKIKIKIYLLGEYGANLRDVGNVARERIMKIIEELGGVEVERVDIVFKGVVRK